MNAFAARRPEIVRSHIALATIAITGGQHVGRAALDGLCLAIERGDGGASALLSLASVRGCI